MMEEAATNVNHMDGHSELHLKYLALVCSLGFFFSLGALFVNESY